jgi:hypothetical protein
MTEPQFIGAFLLGLVVLSIAGFSLPLFCRWGVETQGYRFLCLTQKGAERLAAYSRAEGHGAQVVRIG